MEYFEELALGPKCLIPTSWWMRYVDDVIYITKKDHMDILYNYINQMDDHIEFTMECPDNEGSIPFLDSKCTPNSNHTIHTTVYKNHTYRYLGWNSNHPISAKRSVIQALTKRAKMVCSTPELLAKVLDYLNKVLHRNSYTDWFLNKPNNRPYMDHIPTQETTKEAFVSVPYIQELNEEFRRTFKDTKFQIIFKGYNTLEILLVLPKGKIPTQLCQDVVYQWTCPDDSCNPSYIGKQGQRS